MHTTTSIIRLTLLTAVLTFGVAGAAQAQGYVTPFLGYNFGGDAGCPQITDCQDKRLNFGVAIGSAGPLLGVEEEFGYAKNFFGDIPNTSSSVLTLMTNLMVGPRIVGVRPFGLVGVGLIKTKVDLSPSSLVSFDNNHFGWDVGGGIMVTFGHLGVRGDIRYFHAFQDLSIVGITLSDLKLDFGRASAGLVLQF